MIVSASRHDIQNEGDIKMLVDTLCQKANNDTLLGPSFGAASRIYWPNFLTSQYRYWSSSLLGLQVADGSALPEQVVIPHGGHHVDHWVALFSSSVEELFSGSKAEEAKKLARQLATRISAIRTRELPVD